MAAIWANDISAQHHWRYENIYHNGNNQASNIVPATWTRLLVLRIALAANAGPRHLYPNESFLSMEIVLQFILVEENLANWSCMRSFIKHSLELIGQDYFCINAQRYAQAQLEISVSSSIA